MKVLITFLLISLPTDALIAQVVYSVSTDKNVYDYMDTIHVSIKVVNNQDFPCSMRFPNPCSVNFTIDTLDWMTEAKVGCIQVILNVVLPPHDSSEWTGSYWHYYSF